MKAELAEAYATNPKANPGIMEAIEHAHRIELKAAEECAEAERDRYRVALEEAISTLAEDAMPQVDPYYRNKHRLDERLEELREALSGHDDEQPRA